ncbi:hypothetical protein GC175_14295 [bacterium]|nr:hypothetical protein [bacterium]
MTDNYHAFLVRLWREDESAAWRIRVQCVQGEQTLLFANVEELTLFLNRITQPGTTTHFHLEEQP